MEVWIVISDDVQDFPRAFRTEQEADKFIDGARELEWLNRFTYLKYRAYLISTSKATQ